MRQSLDDAPEGLAILLGLVLLLDDMAMEMRDESAPTTHVRHALASALLALVRLRRGAFHETRHSVDVGGGGGAVEEVVRARVPEVMRAGSSTLLSSTPPSQYKPPRGARSRARSGRPGGGRGGGTGDARVRRGGTPPRRRPRAMRTRWRTGRARPHRRPSTRNRDAKADAKGSRPRRRPEAASTSPSSTPHRDRRGGTTPRRDTPGEWSSPIAREARTEVNQRAGSWFDEMQSRGGVARTRAADFRETGRVCARWRMTSIPLAPNASFRFHRVASAFDAYARARSHRHLARRVDSDARASFRFARARPPRLRRVSSSPSSSTSRCRSRSPHSPRSTFERPSSEKPRDYEQDVQAHPRYGQPRRVGISSLRRPHREG